MRLLDKTGAVLDIQQLGVETRNLDAIKQAALKPNGIILVTRTYRIWKDHYVVCVSYGHQ
jgi:type II secretory ATPase GspE/PulE/Tfp pilus assembly ATPase PilB-like protein